MKFWIKVLQVNQGQSIVTSEKTFKTVQTCRYVRETADSGTISQSKGAFAGVAAKVIEHKWAEND